MLLVRAGGWKGRDEEREIFRVAHQRLPAAFHHAQVAYHVHQGGRMVRRVALKEPGKVPVLTLEFGVGCRPFKLRRGRPV